MATVVKNTPEQIEFQNITPGGSSPTLSVQAGDWETDAGGEVGVVFDVFGPQPPLLSPHDARKLAKWLERAAALLDGKKPDKKHKHPRPNYEDDDDWQR